MRVSAIIVAAGTGRRFGAELPKQFVMLNSKPVLAHTVEKFENCDLIDEIIIVAPIDFLEHTKACCLKKVTKIVSGGETRQTSVFNGLKAVDELSQIVLIHDGARPLVSINDIEASIICAESEGACVLGVKTKSTIKSVNESGFVSKTLTRDSLYEIQTPQAFKKDLIFNAYKKAEKKGFLATDDSALAEHFGAKVKVIEGSYSNIKITTEEDLLFVQMLTLDKGYNKL